MKVICSSGNRKSDAREDILALHTVGTLPDSLEARRRVLCALLEACPRSRYAERISVILEYLEQHQACASTVKNSDPPKKMKNTSAQKPRPQHHASSAVILAVQECREKPLGDPQRVIVLLTHDDAQLPLPYRKALQRCGAVLIEGGTMDKALLRPLKLLAHRTRLVPTLLVSADNWRAWNRRRPLEAALIRRRTHLVSDLSHPSSETN